MDRIYHFLRNMKKFLFKREIKSNPLNYTVYNMNGVFWYRLDPSEPELKFPEVVNMIMRNEDADGE